MSVSRIMGDLSYIQSPDVEMQYRLSSLDLVQLQWHK
jgi:hypothetical protein